jgi:hypothetical protein
VTHRATAGRLLARDPLDPQAPRAPRAVSSTTPSLSRSTAGDPQPGRGRRDVRGQRRPEARFGARASRPADPRRRFRRSGCADGGPASAPGAMPARTRHRQQPQALELAGPRRARASGHLRRHSPRPSGLSAWRLTSPARGTRRGRSRSPRAGPGFGYDP